MTERTDKGAIIFFDGPDGVGKTEQVHRTAEALVHEGYDVHTTRAHGGTPIGEALRNVSLSDTPRSPATDLFVSRAIHAELALDLQERRTRSLICLVDRSPASMWSYQVRGSGLSEQLAQPVIEEDFAWFKADLLIIYTAAIDILRQRRTGRGGAGDYFEKKPDSYHEAVLEGYTEAAALWQGAIIDGGKTPDTVHVATMNQIRKTLPHL